MARFRLRNAHELVTSVGRRRLKAGSTIADTVGNALAGDLVVTSLSSATVTPSMEALDASATTMQNAAPWQGDPNVDGSLPIPTGLSSIDG
jgi:hypothetical protein